MWSTCRLHLLTFSEIPRQVGHPFCAVTYRGFLVFMSASLGIICLSLNRNDSVLEKSTRAKDSTDSGYEKLR